MSSKGYILLHRQIQDCWIWKTGAYDKRSAWIDLLMMVNHNESELFFDGEVQTVKRGQYVTSYRNLAERWGWKKDKVSRFLNALEMDHMITKKSDTKRTLITIINYEIYQNVEKKNATPTKHEQDSDDTKINNVINDNTLNTKNTLYSANFEMFWKTYPRHKEKQKAHKCYLARLKDGFSEEELLQAAKNYADECKRLKREEQYIKLGATFLSANTPFVDYLGKGDSNERNDSTNNGKAEEFTEEQLQTARDYLSGVQRGGLFD